MKTVGIIVATDWEARPLASAHEIQFGEVKTLLMVSGIGQDRARQAAINLMRQKPSFIISCGYGGALRPGMSAGDLALDQQRSDASWFHSIKALCEKQNLRIHAGNFWSGTRALYTAAEKIKTGNETGAILAEMEGNAIWEVCQDAGIGFGAIRAVSDTADQDLPYATRFIGPNGNLTGGFWLNVMLRPHDWPALARMNSATQKANEAINKIFTAYFKELSNGGIHA